MRVVIASDHAGFPLKESLEGFLSQLGHQVVDVGTHGTEPVDYPDYAEALSKALLGGQAERGLLICGSGVGASVAANKLPGIRAGLCHDTYSAHQGVEHDDMNVLVLGGRVIGPELAQELVKAYLGATFTGEERHRRRLEKVHVLEGRLRALQGCGQSVWLDYIRRSLLSSGELTRLIEADGLRGVTSNPAIFEKAITGSTDYVEILQSLAPQYQEAKSLYEQVAIRDIQDAANILRPIYEETRARDGYVSLEVSPYLARDTAGTLAEARRLWRQVDRPNIMIKVPATPEGIPAIEQLISEGINVNVTLLFAQEAYEQVARAYMAGLENRSEQGGDLRHVASVASFFISRIDTAVDALVSERLKTVTSASERALLQSLLGKVAIANAKQTYQLYQDMFRGARWQDLAHQGAQTQRVLWASTSTKNPAYRDVLYVEELIGPDTVNTMPPATFDAFRDHGRVRTRLTEDIEEAYDTMDTLAQVGISMAEVTNTLLDEGVQLFAEAFDKLLAAVEGTRQAAAIPKITQQTSALPAPLAAAVRASLDDWRAGNKVRRLWAHDATLWTGTDEGEWLGWLGLTEEHAAHSDYLKRLAAEAESRLKDAGVTHALLLGMGGSSLGPEVLQMTFGSRQGFPQLHVLDSTDPAQIKAFENTIDLAHTLFIVSSKSGSTLEPNIFKQYFFQRVQERLSVEEAGNRFIAITDPGSKLQQIAESESFRRIFFGLPSIGGRYSALSNFGMVPAAIMGLDISRFLDHVEEMVHACSATVPVEENPGAVLGIILGMLAKHGHDKVTIITSPGIQDFGAWLEQLLAESTGKDGKGLIPVDREPLGTPNVYGNDRMFAYIRLESAPDAAQDAAVEALATAGQPVVRISLADPYQLGAEMFRWEIATAVAGSIIGINPFNQPDVEASKVATRKLTAAYEKTGALPTETPIFTADGIKLFTDEKNSAALAPMVGEKRTLAGYLKVHLSRLGAGDYFALLAYIEMNETHERLLQAIRLGVRDARHVATCLGFGPRFLHSTGQAYKGGPNTGVFLQITCDDAVELPVPGQKYTFGVVKAAQARGDFQVLAERDRRVLRAHLGPDVGAGLATLQAAIAEALVP
jgi:transaldolase / glucose-6-phosphate isomerase